MHCIDGSERVFVRWVGGVTTSDEQLFTTIHSLLGISCNLRGKNKANISFLIFLNRSYENIPAMYFSITSKQ